MYPFMIDIKNKNIVVVGGGKVATNRVQNLLPYAPKITVISPTISKTLKVLIEKEKIGYIQRTFQQSDVEDAFIVIAATNQFETNQLVKNSCSQNQLYNIVDDPAGSSFHFPAMYSNNGITVGVTTSGISPLLAKSLRDEFSQIIKQLDGDYLIFLKEVRQIVKEKHFDSVKKREILQQSLQMKYVESENERKSFLELISSL